MPVKITYFKITHRCFRCNKPLRDDGTCQNKKCVRYKPEKTDDTAVKSE